MVKQKLYKRVLMWTVDSWRYVMDTRYNPLRYIPDPSLQTYFMLVLFTIWSVWFGFLAANYLGWFGYNTVASIFIHIAVLLPIAFTNAVFVDAERDGSKWVKDWREEQSNYLFWMNRFSLKNRKNVVEWDLDKEG